MTQLLGHLLSVSQLLLRGSVTRLADGHSNEISSDGYSKYGQNDPVLGHSSVPCEDRNLRDGRAVKETTRMNR